MNSIVFTHFATPMEGASGLAVALHRLGAWFDAEIGSLEDLLDTAGDENAIDDIEAMHDLHLDADATFGDLARLLDGARPTLERLLGRVRVIDLEGPHAGPAASEFEAWVRWTEARLVDVLTTLDCALAA